MRLGDLDALKDIAYINKGNFNTVEGIREWIDNAPTVKLEYVPNYANCESVAMVRVSRPQGEWIKLRDYDYKCSVCGYSLMDKYNFCPECGADMRGDNNEVHDNN